MPSCTACGEERAHREIYIAAEEPVLMWQGALELSCLTFWNDQTQPPTDKAESRNMCKRHWLAIAAIISGAPARTRRPSAAGF